MKIKHIILIVLLNCMAFNLHAQKVDVDKLLKQALHETNVTKNYPKAKTLAKKGLKISPNYTDIRLLLGRLYRLTDQPDSARLEFAKVLAKEPTNADALNYLKSLDNAQEADEIASLKNRVSITYNPTFFEREGKNNWNLLNVYYARLTKYGTILGRINYANRSYADGLQYELEAYPKHKTNNYWV
ncbi:MAG: tetratricopeptide repeat protein, partial [Pedobacter sp.]